MDYENNCLLQLLLQWALPLFKVTAALKLSDKWLILNLNSEVFSYLRAAVDESQHS